MSDLVGVSAARIFDGHSWHDDAVILAEFGYVIGIVPRGDTPSGAQTVELAGGMLVPGFVDLQVNGGGGVLFNNDPSVEGIRRICAAHAQFGTTALLPTLITDTVAVNVAAIAAGKAAAEQRVPGFAGLHLEGPHLSVVRKGTHEGALVRPMDEADLSRLIAARQDLPALLCTIAAESVHPEQVAALAAADIVVSLGHTDATWEDADRLFSAGATMATHLFNAMSQFTSREPGLVGAALNAGTVHTGLIADGIHVHPEAIKLALRSKAGPAHIFLVTDAMSQTGTDLTSLTLNGRTITRANGALRLADGTLAGADLDMIDAVRFMAGTVGLPLDESLRMAALYPAQAMRLDAHGHLGAGAALDFVHLSDDLEVLSTWIGGTAVWRR